MSPSTFDIAETTKKRNLIIKKSKDLGFDVIGFANPKLPKSVKKNLDSFLNSNFHGEMDWLKRNKHRRESPENLWSCLLYTSPSPRDAHESRMPSSA